MITEICTRLSTLSIAGESAIANGFVVLVPWA